MRNLSEKGPIYNLFPISKTACRQGSEELLKSTAGSSFEEKFINYTISEIGNIGSQNRHLYDNIPLWGGLRQRYLQNHGILTDEIPEYYLFGTTYSYRVLRAEAELRFGKLPEVSLHTVNTSFISFIDQEEVRSQVEKFLLHKGIPPLRMIESFMVGTERKFKELLIQEKTLSHYIDKILSQLNNLKPEDQKLFNSGIVDIYSVFKTNQEQEDFADLFTNKLSDPGSL